MEKVRFAGLKVLKGLFKRYKGENNLIDVPIRAIGIMKGSKWHSSCTNKDLKFRKYT